MENTIKIFKNEINDWKFESIKQNENIYFKAKDIATILGYVNTEQAIRFNVDDDDKIKLNELQTAKNSGLASNKKNTIYINESGLYCLIFGSKKEEAKQFKKWITTDILPTIRKTGGYELVPKHNQIFLKNEADLHKTIISFLKNNYPSCLFNSSLGEYINDTNNKRKDAYLMGYTAGIPDLIIYEYNKNYSGFCIELKNPNGKGVVSEKQEIIKSKLDNRGYKTLISCDLTEIIKEITIYLENIRYPCCYCHNKRKFKDEHNLTKHRKLFHKK
jgi:prophage antirepressor-like protein